MNFLTNLNDYEGITLLSAFLSMFLCVVGLFTNNTIIAIMAWGFSAILISFYGLLTKPTNSDYVAYSNVIRYLHQKRVNYGNNRIIISAIKYVTELRDKSA